VLGCRFLVAIVELFFVNSLLDEENIGAQFQKRIQFIGRHSRPGFDLYGTFGHECEFNV
jgi:hypothetical protein